MHPLYKAARLIIIFGLILGVSLPGVPARSSDPSTARAHPLLFKLAQEDPAQRVAVIVQKMGTYGLAEQAASYLGGKITKDLGLINAFVVEMDASSALELAKHADVRWVSPDGPVTKAGTTRQPAGVTLLAGFDTHEYNPGVSNWQSAWLELGEQDGPDAGDVAITSFLGGTENGLRIQGSGKGVQSVVDLSLADSASLVFSFRRKDFNSPEDYVRLEISTDEGQTWSVAALMEGPAVDTGMMTNEIWLAEYLPGKLQIRFISSDQMGEQARFYVDYVQVDYTTLAKETPTFDYKVHLPALSSTGSTIDRDGLAAASTTTATLVYAVKDEFSTVSYSNNNGSANWLSSWAESDTAGAGPYSGFIHVSNGELHIGGSTNPTNQSSITRNVNLANGAFFATLSFNFATSAGVDPDDVIALEISRYGGNFKTLDVFSGYQGVFSGMRSYDLSAYLSADTTIRFKVSSKFDAADEYIALDNIQISYSPPTLADQFGTSAYINTDGGLKWMEPWVETDSYGGSGSTGGYISVTAGRLQFHYAWVGFESISRSANLSGYTQATLSFDWQTSGLDSGETLSVLVSKDSSTPFVELNAYGGSLSGSATFDITPYISNATRIRIEPRNQNWEYGEYAFIDNVQISLSGRCEACIDAAHLANTYVRAINADQVWNTSDYLQGQNVTLAVVDSGISLHNDFLDNKGNSRLLAQVQFGVSNALSDDFYGHGTHVAGAAAGNGSQSSGSYIGSAPRVNLVDVKVMDDLGMGYTSDVVAGLQWVYENKNLYNIRVVNLSLNGTVVESYLTSPLDAALEILWFNGMAVVVSSGNNGSTNTGVVFPPANDPFLITIGSADDRGTPGISDDILASYSAYGTTSDGFSKPDLVVSGSNVVSLLAGDDCNLVIDHLNNVVLGQNGYNYFRMSGTSMASGVAAGAVALLIQDEPNLTPDQIKYRLTSTARPFVTGSGAGYMDVLAAVNGASTQSANNGLVASSLLWSGADPITWGSVAWNSVAWNSVAWNSVAWNSVAWNSVAWNSDYWEP